MLRNTSGQNIQAMMRTSNAAITAIVPISAISSCTSTNTNASPVVVTTSGSTPHGMIPGNRVEISGSSQTAINGTWVVFNVPSNTSFQIADPNTGAVLNGNGGSTGTGATVTPRSVSVYVSKDGGALTAGTGTLSHIGRGAFNVALSTNSHQTRSVAATVAATQSVVGNTQISPSSSVGGINSTTLGLWNYSPSATETDASVVTFTFFSPVLGAISVTQTFEPQNTMIASSGTSNTNTTTTVVFNDSVNTTTDYYVGGIVMFTSGNSKGQSRVVTASSNSANVTTLTVNRAFTSTPTASATYVVISADALKTDSSLRATVTGGGSAPTAAEVATAVWQDTTAGDFTVSGSIGKSLAPSTLGTAPGASGGLLISGSNSGTTTLGALTVTGATTLTGAVSLGSTLGVTGTTTLAAVTTTGTVTFNAFTCTNVFTVSGATTLTGAVTASNASNNIVGIDVAKISGDSAAADNAEAFFDGTGYAGTNNVIPSVTTVTNLTNAATNGDLTATMKTSVTTAATAATPVAASVTGAVGSVTGNVGGNVVGSVASVSGAVGSVTGNVGGNVTGSVGSVVGAVGSVTGLTVANLDAAISSRMATYTQPTGFLAATFPTTVASTTNITGGTITTVTNLTNAPTSGDLTATMKASVNTEIDTALADIHLDHLLAADYDPASKPGVSTALLNELIGNDAGVSQFTANALELAPSSSGTGMNAAETRAALGLASANLDTQFSTVTAKTNLIPASPASTTNITAATGVVLSGVTHTGAVIPTVTALTNAPAITSNVKKNQALTSFMFLMTDSTNHAPATSKTVSVTRSIDGAAFGAGTLSSVTEVSSGVYKVDFAAADLNGNVIILRATATGCDDTFERILTQP